MSIRALAVDLARQALNGSLIQCGLRTGDVARAVDDMETFVRALVQQQLSSQGCLSVDRTLRTDVVVSEINAPSSTSN